MFKPETIQIANGTDYTLEKKNLSEIFQFYSPPYICTAKSGKGKTTLAIDIIYTFAKQCSNIYYITATTETMIDNAISLIPKAFRREPTLENMMNVWQEVKNQNECINAPPEQIDKIIITIYGENIAKKINDEIEEQKQIIIARNSKLYKDKSLIKNDILAFVYELKRRIILFGLYEKADEGIEEKLTVQQSNIINSFVSKPNRSLIIMDDITSELQKLQTDNSKIEYNGEFINKRDAFQQLLTDILTRARHYNCLVIFFVHTIEIFKQREMIENIVMFDNGNVQKILNLRSINQSIKSLIKRCSERIFSNPNYEYMFVYCCISSEYLCVGKAALHTDNEKLEISEQSQKFLDIYTSVLSGFETVVNPQPKLVITQEDSEEESEEVL